jgi:hypothetical protein
VTTIVCSYVGRYNVTCYYALFNPEPHVSDCVVSNGILNFLLPDVYSFTVYRAVLHASVAGLLASSQYPEGPATGHLGTGFSWFLFV